MLEIKNLLFQPLTLHLADSNKTIHLTSRGKTTIKEKYLSQEIKNAQSKGWISIKEADSQKPVADSNQSETDSQKATKKRRAK